MKVKNCFCRKKIGDKNWRPGTFHILRTVPHAKVVPLSNGFHTLAYVFHIPAAQGWKEHGRTSTLTPVLPLGPAVISANITNRNKRAERLTCACWVACYVQLAYCGRIDKEHAMNLIMYLCILRLLRARWTFEGNVKRDVAERECNRKKKKWLRIGSSDGL
jgi:hypothetical protein